MIPRLMNKIKAFLSNLDYDFSSDTYSHIVVT